MKLTVNGEVRDVPDALRIPALLELLGVAPGRVAVEVNGTVVRKPQHPETLLRDGDAVEVVTFVGGG